MKQKFATMKAAARANPNSDHATRDQHLSKMADLITENSDAIIAAICEDFGHRSPIETQFGETLNALADIKHTRKKLAQWMRPEKRSVGMHFLPARNEVRYQPKGVVGVISPWNYPFSMAINPTIGALAAGNRVMIKPSELTPKLSALLAILIAQYFEADHVTVITGGVDVAQQFSALPFDHLVFTGSTKVGQLVMQAAAKRPELAGVFTSLDVNVPSYKADVDTEKARSLGVDIADLNTTMASTFGSSLRGIVPSMQ